MADDTTNIVIVFILLLRFRRENLWVFGLIVASHKAEKIFVTIVADHA